MEQLMKAKKTRTHKIWIMADNYDYDFFTCRKNPADDRLLSYDPDFSMCRDGDGFRRVFGGLGIKPYATAKRYEITITEITP